jgi:hypothetical protein
VVDTGETRVASIQLADFLRSEFTDLFTKSLAGLRDKFSRFDMSALIFLSLKLKFKRPFFEEGKHDLFNL